VDPFLLALAAKMMVTVVIVVLASVLVEKTGPFIGAMIATLPISAGPSYVFLAWDHGPDFIASSALMTLHVNAATGLFAATYALLAQRLNLAGSLLAALFAWAGAVFVFARIERDLFSGVLVNVVVYTTAILLTRAMRRSPPVRSPRRRWWEVPARAAGVMTLVAVVVLAGNALGPTAAGIAAPFPIVMSSLVVILHSSIGGRAASSTLAHTLPGMVGFGIAVLVLQTSVLAVGNAVALSAALAICLAWNGALVAISARRARRAAAA